MTEDIHHGRLVHLIRAARQSVTLLLAPTGYGKTSLLRRLGSALAEDGSATLWIEGRAPPPASDVETWVAAARQRNAAQPAFILSDDVHLIADAALRAALAAIAVAADASIRIVLSARSWPHLSLARLQGADRLLLLDVERLALPPAEAAALAPEAWDAEIEPMRGWPAALIIRAARGAAWWFDFQRYIDEEVLAPLDREEIDLLLRTSLLPRLNTPLCVAMAASPRAEATLNRLCHSGFPFLRATDPDGDVWYLHHPLVARRLREIMRERDPDLVPELAEAALALLEEGNHPEDAIRLAAETGQAARAARLLDAHWDTMVAAGRIFAAVELADLLPKRSLAPFPRVQLGRAMVKAAHRRFGEVNSILDEVERNSAATSVPGAVRSHVRLQRMLAAWFSDDMATTAAFSDEIRRDDLAGGDTQIDGLLIDEASAAVAHDGFRLAEAEQIYLRSMGIWDQLDIPTFRFWVRCFLGPVQAQMGKTESALALYRKAIALAGRMPGKDTIDFLPHVLLGATHAERFELAEARAALDQHLHHAWEAGPQMHLVAPVLAQVRLLALEQRFVEAEAALRMADDYAGQYGVRRLRVWVAAERMRILERQGLTDAALQVAAACLPDGPVQARFPGRATSGVNEAEALIAAQRALILNRYEDGLKLVGRWVDFASRTASATTQVRMGILAARLHSAMGNGTAALRAARGAMGCARRGNLYLPFAEAGGPVLSLVARAYGLGEGMAALEERPQDLFRAIEASQPGTSPSLPAPATQPAESRREGLTDREIEIMRMVSRDFSNRGIAEHLGLTEGTVKWYLQRTYAKLGVSRRLAAIYEARRQGYV